MILKFEVYKNNEPEKTLFYECDDGDSDNVRKTIIVAIMEFKTNCMINNAPYNTWHMINWLKKYKGIEFSPAPTARIVRVDM